MSKNDVTFTIMLKSGNGFTFTGTKEFYGDIVNWLRSEKIAMNEGITVHGGREVTFVKAHVDYISLEK